MNKIVTFLVAMLFISGCAQTQFAPPSNARGAGNSSVSSTTYTCSVGSGGTGDFCDVQGYVNNIDVSSTTPHIIFRTNAISADDFDNSGKWIAIIQSGSLQGYCRATSYVTGTSGTEIITTNFGNQVITRNGEIYVVTKDHSRKYSACLSADTTSTPKEPYKSNNQEKTDIAYSYTVDYNFCPSGDSNFAYCNGANSVRTETQPGWSGSTTEYRLNEGQLLQFDPRDGNNNPLPQDKFYIRVQKWDMSCNTDYTGKCDVNSQDVYCKCSSGQTFYASEDCHWLDGIDISNGQRSNVCKESVWDDHCYSVKSYQSCGAVNANGCPIWGSSTLDCSDGKKCYVGTVPKEGVGQCKCASTECNKGERRVSQLGGEYDECIQISSSGCDYNEWQSKTCLNSPTLHYDSTSKKCVNDANDPKCQPYVTYKECIGNDLYSCVSNGIQDENGNYKWSLSKETTCTNPYECLDSGNFDHCGCRCQTNQKRCITGSQTEYQLCGSACWENKPIPSGQLCVNNSLMDKNTVACEQGGTVCPTGKQCNEATKVCIDAGCAYGTQTCNTAIGQECDRNTASPAYNTCICKDDTTYCRGRETQIKCIDLLNYQQCLSSTSSCPYWGATTRIPDARVCKEGVLTCPTSADGDQWCDKVQADTGATRCKHFPEKVEKCMASNGCYQFIETDACDLNYVCVE